jgi:Uma2 family endonuclease
MGVEVRMDEVTLRRMTIAEFFDWEPGDEERYELVDGRPVRMTGARRRHDRILMNLHRELSTRLLGSPCIPFSPDTAVLIPNGNVRRPDAGVDCGRDDDSLMHADLPRIVIEVLSPSTRRTDLNEKLAEYKTIGSLLHVLLIDPDEPEVTHWSRDQASAWRQQSHAGLGAVIEIADPRLALGLADIYRGLAFTPPP